jgi:hypothetical protein
LLIQSFIISIFIIIIVQTNIKKLLGNFVWFAQPKPTIWYYLFAIFMYRNDKKRKKTQYCGFNPQLLEFMMMLDKVDVLQFFPV